jgi:predicted nucleic-acid-binding protein
LALAEATWVLSAVYERGPTEIASAVEMLLNHKELSLQDSDVVAAALRCSRERPALGFSDCLLLELASVALGKYDDLFEKRQVVVTPGVSLAYADLKVGATGKRIFQTQH